MSPNISERRIESIIEQLSAEASVDQLDALSQQLFAALEVANVLSVLQSLAEKPFLLEWILSSFPRQASLRAWIEHLFPKDAITFKGSFIGQLVMRLSTFFLLQHDLPVPPEYSLLPDVDKLVGKGPYSLDLLSQMTFLEERSEDSFVKPKVKSKRKGHKKSTSHSQEEVTGRKFDPSVLSEFKLEIPRNTIERDRAVSVVLSCMKNCLTFYLVVLGNVRVAEAIKSRFLSHLMPTNQDYGQSECLTAEATDHSSNFIQPFKAARHFSNVEGFGDWRILISTRADGDLREASRKNRKMFRIYMKKIKELSNGHFSPDNHKRLTGLNNEVPVYEAKMTSDTRLVYQVDCVADYDSEAETQVVRIFGIYTHAQMDDRLWHSVGSQLAKKGKEYRKRCAYRQRANSGESDLYTPATFPQPPEVKQTPQTIPELPPDDLDQIHSLLVLEKYLDFSHELLQSILANLDVSFPFQVSPQEKEIIEHTDSCYVLGRSGTGKTTTMLFKMLWVEKAYEVNKDGMPRPRQIFVTKSRVLARKVEESFVKLLASLRIEAKPLRELQMLLRHDPASKSDDLVDVDDEVNWRSDLPKQFSDLQDHHFPLFLTFDHLCDLIEGDADNLLSPGLSSSTGDSVPSISFEHFRYQYWPHFPQSLTKGLDPALVFSEIIGIIKGSEETLSTDGILSRKAYEGLSERGYSTFASQRSIVYSIFEAYQAQKRQRGERDNADRTHTLLQTIQANGVRGRKIDQLYVDEAQDNLLIDALVLRSLSHNANGLFWAGDTAQTISVGSSFRFDDLKAFLFRVEQQRNNVNKLRTNQANGVKPPKAFQLVTNYRSHGGIVNCAHSVIELVSAYWPYSIDNLQPEKGIVDGPKPLFLIGWDNDNIRYEQFLFGASGSQIEFGAQQCILVRDEAARAKLQEQVGEIGLIMTLYESKGLEFNDVLLFNFFEDSACDLSQWRLILNEVTNKSKSILPLAPRFEPLRHAPICFELKSLYVALTRARKNLWIADKSAKGDPMRMYWSSREQVQTCNPGDKIPQLAVASSPEEWASKGQELFRRKRYLQAKYCFDRARQPWEATVSEAYLLREEARKIPVIANSKVTLQKRQQSFRKAAEAFINCSRDAARNKSVYITRAAECFEEAGDDLRAARAYLEAESFDNAAKLFRKLGRFDDAVRVIKHNSRQMNPQVVETITDVARLYYIREEEFGKARDLFATDDEELEYLEDLDLDLARADILVSLGRYSEAAKLHVSEGRAMSAIPLFLKDADSPDSSREAGAAILRELWRKASIGQPSAILGSDGTLLRWLEAIEIENQEKDVGIELSMFKALLSGKRPSPQLHQHVEDLFSTDNRTAALFCLDHTFATFPDPKRQSGHELASTLAMFLSYIRQLYDLAFRPHMHEIVTIEKLFSCCPSTGETYLIPEGTLLYPYLSGIAAATSSALQVSKTELYGAIRHVLCQRIREKVGEQMDACRKGTQFSTCINFAVSGMCNRLSCPLEHISMMSMTPEWYSTKVRLQLLQILIQQIHHLVGIDNLSRRRQRRTLLNRLCDSLFPSFYGLGTLQHLLVSSIPEWSRGVQVVGDWVQELAYELDLRGQSNYTLTHLFTGVRLGFYLDHEKAATQWTHSLAAQQLIVPFKREHADSLAREIAISNELRQPFSLWAGVLVLQHIVTNRLPIAVGTLCDYVEYLCRSIVTSNRLKRGHGLHGLTLPCSWLPHCVSTKEMLETMQLPTSLLFQLVDHVAVLLGIIYSGEGADFLLYDTGNLSSIMSINVHAVFLIRLIRAICILGYNITIFSLRNNIARAMATLRRSDQRMHPLYRQFAECRQWEHLVRALRSIDYSPLSDHLVQLHDLRQGPGPTFPLKGVTVLLYKDNDDLGSQLAGQQTGFNATLSTNNAGDVVAHENNESLEAPIAQETINEGSAETEAGQDLQIDTTDQDIDGTGIADDATAHDSDTGNDIDINVLLAKQPLEEIVPSAKEIKGAVIIQEFYRTAVRRRAGKDLQGLEAVRGRLFLKCLEHARSIDWRGLSRYRQMMLGPLPHILLCLEVSSAALTTHKSKVKKRLLSGNHQELDAIGPQMTRLQNAFKGLRQLARTLEPNSDMHALQDCTVLRRRIQECNDQLRSMPIPLPQEVAGDLALGVKGIVTERKHKPQAAPKPSLVVDDDFDEWA